MDLGISIQAGGASSRMGQDKALMDFMGEPLICRVVRRLKPLSTEMLVTTNQPELYEFLHLRMTADILPGKGALGGLYTALASLENPIVAVVACDLPFVNTKLLAAQLDLLLESGADVVIPESPDGIEPLHCMYRKEPCEQAVRAALENGLRKMTAWFGQVQVRKMGVDEVSSYDPGFRSFINVNTPEEFSLAERLAAELDWVP
jgi:molybdopterin-guanine dinucleotide biosynthesis protein A